MLENFNIIKVVHLFFGIIFLTSGIFINLVQFCLYLTLYSINRSLFRKINFYLCGFLFSQIVFLIQYWAEIKITLLINKEDYLKYLGKEPAFVIMNHSYEIDWMMGWALCDHFKVLGNCKSIAKKSLQYIPTLGFAWKMSGSIFVERNWQKDQKILENKIQELLEYSDPFWLLLAAEGTRFTKEKHEASLAFAKKRELPLLRHHLTPRTKGFTMALPCIRNKIPAIYNINVAVKPNITKPTLTNVLYKKSFEAEFYVARIPMTDLPESEAELISWLHRLYKEKDDLIDNFLTKGQWFENYNSQTHLRIPLTPRPYVLLNFVFLCFATLTPMGYFLFKLLISGSLIKLGTACAVIGSFGYLLDKLVCEAKMSKASSYGIDKGESKSSESQKEN